MKRRYVKSVLELVRPSIQNKIPYKGGKQIHDYTGWVKLNQNESPYDPAPKVLAALDKAKEHGHRYPPQDHRELKERVAQYLNVGPTQISFGNGSDEGLQNIALVFLEKGDVLCYPSPDYSMWEDFRYLVGSETKIVELPDGYELPIDEIIKIKPKVLFYSNPNTPSGKFTQTKKIQRLVEELFPRIVVQDEAYGDYAEGSALELVRSKDYPNLIVVKTLSKSHNLAGYRVGYCVGHPDVISRVEAIRLPYNITWPSYLVALAAFEQESIEYTNEKIKITKNERNKLYAELNELGFYVRPSQANFLLARTDSPESAKTLFERLVENNVLVRYFSSGRLSDCLRITVGKPEENSIFIEKLKELMKELG